ncbi:hypothetical protein AZF37_08200 [endosymbiont 'TC1' of Trimyema compressum]|uniref:AAA family ATPase n=1 Tax=endosymbiont 'TC1' of Trimyema compressum TaxID=243899 RepID=UPI0007F0F6EC|nr:AAA family ATPase [endosymbiont 'TC1' of Trimyema compressum]AMP21141.1 hypothetical protein AZF37_08200 [endosymbiont 'TC1' of Trimyema compressum]
MKLEAIKDQDNTVRLLQRALANKRFNHAYLFVGKKGIGKKLTALAFAKELLCSGDTEKEGRFDAGTFGDFMAFYDSGDKLKIGDVRGLIEESYMTTYEGSYRVIFIENGERMTEESSNALLKTLEEPNPGTVFVMTVSEPDKILPTLFSRMEKYYFNPLSEKTIKDIFAKQGYEKIPFGSLGTIDEIKVLLEYGDEDVLLFPDFYKLLQSKNLPAIFKECENLAKKPYLKALLSYYEKESNQQYILNFNNREKAQVFEVMIKSFEEIQRKINGYINEKHALEYGFLKIMENMKEV